MEHKISYNKVSLVTSSVLIVKDHLYLTCSGGIDLLNHTGMSTIHSRRRGKRQTKTYKADRRIPMKILTFPTEMKPSKCPAKDKKKKRDKKSERSGEEGKRKSRNSDFYLRPKQICLEMMTS